MLRIPPLQLPQRSFTLLPPSSLCAKPILLLSLPQLLFKNETEKKNPLQLPFSSVINNCSIYIVSNAFHFALLSVQSIYNIHYSTEIIFGGKLKDTLVLILYYFSPLLTTFSLFKSSQPMIFVMAPFFLSFLASHSFSVSSVGSTISDYP